VTVLLPSMVIPSGLAQPVRSPLQPGAAAAAVVGQNVLYKDGHVKFETGPLVGLAGDNIYTYRNSSGVDPSLGAGPVDDGDPLAYPWDEGDALLFGERNGRSR
jgi:hypothetical protein